jgi:bifunctional ADP-heptose synthase (sugar kinase/adenylyltransferase)
MPLSIIGNDGEGYELRQALAELPAVEPSGILSWPGRRTPTYTKPMLQQPGQPARELNRLDIHNRQPLPDEAQEQLLELLDAAWTEIHAIMILDQVRQPDCGVVTARVRDWLAGNSARWPRRWMLADSRERIGLFRGVCLKPNASECRRATGVEDTATAAQVLAQRTGRPVFCTEGERGMVLAEPGQPSQWIPGYAVTGPVDPVGAGDSCNAALLAALAAGLSLTEAAALGNLVASITVQQLGTTGTASPAQVRQRFQEVKIL